ncbi:MULTISPECIES: membrane protein [unclassified Pseudoxanthomonas]|uniref:membrane protein n=1 Tax=unclassified Pseudoxanthomonas TaxID=2645906 RepID=UPI0003104ABC|nr:MULTISPECIES: membrane protein [unclassified Pseudoxanthomonas]
MSTGALKPLRRPHLWLGLWLLAVAVVCVASLTPPPPMELPRHGDKVEHLLAYAALAAAAVQVFRPGRALWAAGIGLVLMGVALEFAQGALTQTRMADPADALANTAGVLLGLGTRLTRWRDLLLRRGG